MAGGCEPVHGRVELAPDALTTVGGTQRLATADRRHPGIERSLPELLG
jgi:hypothetical protein